MKRLPKIPNYLCACLSIYREFWEAVSPWRCSSSRGRSTWYEGGSRQPHWSSPCGVAMPPMSIPYPWPPGKYIKYRCQVHRLRKCRRFQLLPVQELPLPLPLPLLKSESSLYPSTSYSLSLTTMLHHILMFPLIATKNLLPASDRSLQRTK